MFSSFPFLIFLIINFALIKAEAQSNLIKTNPDSTLIYLDQLNRNVDIGDLELVATIELDNNNQILSGKAHIKIIQDSLVSVKINKMVELGRAFFYKNSSFFVNSISKEKKVINFKDFSNSLTDSLAFRFLESVLTSNFRILKSDSILINGNEIRICKEFNNLKINYLFEKFRVKTIEVFDDKQSQILCEVSEYETVENYIIPTQLNIKIDWNSIQNRKQLVLYITKFRIKKNNWQKGIKKSSERE
jgi:hypothetical protein